MKIRKTIDLTKIQQKLTELGFNQSKLADKLNVSRETVSKWFKQENQPSAGKLLAISRLLNLSFDDILTVEYLDQPIVAFRKNATAKVSEEDIEAATSMGNTIKKLIPYFQSNASTKPPILINPKNDYSYINEVVCKIKSEAKLDPDITTFDDIVSIFYMYNSIIIPVLWGEGKKGENTRHANALRIYLPDSMTTWIYLNLNTKIHDFKFWMAHELGHVLATDLKGKASEDFADNFAGALLFPENQAKNLYKELCNIKSERDQIDLIINTGKDHIISPLSVYLQVESYCKHHNLPVINLKRLIYPFNTKYNSYFPTAAENIFNTQNPKAASYISFVNSQFTPPFFTYLKRYIMEEQTSPTFIQNLLDISYVDALNIHDALINSK